MTLNNMSSIKPSLMNKIKTKRRLLGLQEQYENCQYSRDANKLRTKVDDQYLKVVVEDELGIEVELDQRSEGFQWMVSF